MNHNKVSGPADDAKKADTPPDARASAQGGSEVKGPARGKEGRLRKAYGDIKEALKNSRHT